MPWVALGPAGRDAHLRKAEQAEGGLRDPCCAFFGLAFVSPLRCSCSPLLVLWQIEVTEHPDHMTRGHDLARGGQQARTSTMLKALAGGTRERM